jgi:hypothetical protein
MGNQQAGFQPRQSRCGKWHRSPQRVQGTSRRITAQVDGSPSPPPLLAAAQRHLRLEQVCRHGRLPAHHLPPGLVALRKGRAIHMPQHGTK